MDILHDRLIWQVLSRGHAFLLEGRIFERRIPLTRSAPLRTPWGAPRSFLALYSPGCMEGEFSEGRGLGEAVRTAPTTFLRRGHHARAPSIPCRRAVRPCPQPRSSTPPTRSGLPAPVRALRRPSPCRQPSGSRPSPRGAICSTLSAPSCLPLPADHLPTKNHPLVARWLPRQARLRRAPGRPEPRGCRSG